MTHKKYWNCQYRDTPLEDLEHANEGPRSRIKRVLGCLLGEQIFEFMPSYKDYLLWKVLYPKYMPRRKGAKVLEVGSAPGTALIRLHHRFGYAPYGVDYSESGVHLNRQIFASHSIDPNNVIHADFCSSEFHSQYKGYFDVVISNGFIEHFANVRDVVEKHVDLLTNGGCLFVSIPNFRGVNYVLTWLFNREYIAMHNLSIMRREKFVRLFSKDRLRPLFRDYVGTFDFALFSAKAGSPMRWVLILCKKVQFLLNVAFGLLFREKGAETRLFSPYLMFIGVKKG